MLRINKYSQKKDHQKMRVAKVLEETNVSNYSYALLTTETRKTCTHLAVSIAQSHDKLYRPFKDAWTHARALRDHLLGIVKSELTCKPMQRLLWIYIFLLLDS
jgi:hypothetical protein